MNNQQKGSIHVMNRRSIILHILQVKEDSEEQIIEVMNGCICCTVRGDLVKVLKRLKRRLHDIDGVIIETTGLADPAPVAQTFFMDDEIGESYRLDGIITVVDAKHIMEHLQEEKPEGVENESVEQIAFADRIILNKTDLVDEKKLKEVEGAVQKINRSAEIMRSQYLDLRNNLIRGTGLNSYGLAVKKNMMAIAPIGVVPGARRRNNQICHSESRPSSDDDVLLQHI